MPLIKISLFQKNISEGMNINVMKKIVALKSDMLVFPALFYADPSIKQLSDLKDRYPLTIDWLLKLSQSYKGIIIGGSLIKEEQGKLYHATPVVYDENVIDWYHKRILDNEEKSFIEPGRDAGIFMLNNIRFAILIDREITNTTFIKELKENQVNLIFNISASFENEQNGEKQLETENEFYHHLSKEHDITIVRCEPVGSLFGKKLSGRSLLATPKGISWHTTRYDSNKQILKDLMVHI